MYRLQAVLAVLEHPFPIHGWGSLVCEELVADLDWVTGCAITVHASREELELFGFSHDWVRRLHDTAYGLGEGPGFDAYTTAAPVIADQGQAWVRWPWFTPAAVMCGVGQMAAFPLRSGATVYGSLSMYSRVPEPIPREADRQLDFLVARAGACVAHRITVDRTGELSAVMYREVHIACGMIAAAAHIGLDEALARLRAHAFTTGRALPALAGDIIAGDVGIEVVADH